MEFLGFRFAAGLLGGGAFKVQVLGCYRVFVFLGVRFRALRI